MGEGGQGGGGWWHRISDVPTPADRIASTVVNIPAWLYGAVGFLRDVTAHVRHPGINTTPGQVVVGMNADGRPRTTHTITANEALKLLQERQLAVYNNVMHEMTVTHKKSGHWIWWCFPTIFEGGLEANVANMYGVSKADYPTYVVPHTAVKLMSQDYGRRLFASAKDGPGPMQNMLTAVCDCLYSTMRDNNVNAARALSMTGFSETDVGRMKAFAGEWHDIIRELSAHNDAIKAGRSTGPTRRATSRMLISF